ncbi:MAG: hypothetical protein QM811_26215 [Pirellulales bacterium]
MRLFQNESFDGGSFVDRDSAATFCDLEFRKCYFQGCVLSITGDPAFRTKVQNVKLVNCSQRGGALYSAVLEDVLVDGFKTHGLFQTFGAVFNRVVLKGKIDRLMLSTSVYQTQGVSEHLQSFHQANAEYYRNVEWALDISKAEFKELDVRGIPGHLIRRDPETQFLVTREKALQETWRSLDLQESIWSTAFWLLKQSSDQSTVLIAPKRHAKFQRYLADLKLMQSAGVIEPD